MIPFPYPRSPLAQILQHFQFPVKETAVAAAHVCHFWSHFK